MEARKKMTEEQMVGLVRNALLVAGNELGKTGDHWPVVKSTIHDIAKDWQALQTERNVSAELETHYADIINDIEKNLHLCPPELRPEAEKMIRELRELHQARFETVDNEMIVACDEDVPIHVKRAEAIIKTLEADDE